MSDSNRRQFDILLLHRRNVTRPLVSHRIPVGNLIFESQRCKRFSTDVGHCSGDLGIGGAVKHRHIVQSIHTGINSGHIDIRDLSLASGQDFLMTLGHESDEMEVFQFGQDSVRGAEGRGDGVGVGFLHERALGGRGDFLTPLAGNQMAQHMHMAVFATHHLRGVVRGTRLGANHIVLSDGHIEHIGGVGLIGGVIQLHRQGELAGGPVQRALGSDVDRGRLTQDGVGVSSPFVTAQRSVTASKDVTVDRAGRIAGQTRLVGQGIAELGGVGVGGIGASVHINDEHLTGVRSCNLIGNSVTVRTIATVNTRIFLQKNILVGRSGGNKLIALCRQGKRSQQSDDNKR